MAEKSAAVASLRPSEAKSGGGLFGDMDLTITKAKFALFDYGGTKPAVPAAYFGFEDGEKVEFEQYWSIGNAKDWIPDETGNKLMYVGQSASPALNANTNGMVMFASMVNAGYPEDQISDDISDFIGLVAHWERLPAPARPGLKKEERADGRQYDATILCVTKIIQLPWEKKETGKKGAGRPAGTTTSKKEKPAEKAADAKNEQSVEEVAEEAVMRVLIANPDGISKVGLSKALYNDEEIPKAMRQAAAGLIYKDPFHVGKPWEVKAGIVKLAE